jgi:hypothetical protein
MSVSATLSMAAALGLAFFASPGAVPGIPSTRSAQQWGAAVMETLQANLRVEPIRLNDLAPAPSMSEGSANATAVALGPARLGASYSIPMQSVNPVVVRELNRIWRLTIPAGNRARSQVTVAIESLRGEPGRLSLLGHEEISIPVAVLERAVTVRLEDAGSRILEGGVALQIPSASLQHAGQYAGRLVLRTEGF